MHVTSLIQQQACLWTPHIWMALGEKAIIHTWGLYLGLELEPGPQSFSSCRPHLHRSPITHPNPTYPLSLWLWMRSWGGLAIVTMLRSGSWCLMRGLEGGVVVELSVEVSWDREESRNRDERAAKQVLRSRMEEEGRIWGRGLQQGFWRSLWFWIITTQCRWSWTVSQNLSSEWSVKNRLHIVDANNVTITFLRRKGITWQ